MNCEPRDRISRIGLVIVEKFPCFLVDIITKYCQNNKRNPPGDLNTLDVLNFVPPSKEYVTYKTANQWMGEISTSKRYYTHRRH